MSCGFFLVSPLPGERCSSVLRLASIDESESESQDSAFDVNRYTDNLVQERSASTIEERLGRTAAQTD